MSNECSICKKKFATKSTLATHQKTAKFCKRIASDQVQPTTASVAEPVDDDPEPTPAPETVVSAPETTQATAQSDAQAAADREDATQLYYSFIAEMRQRYREIIDERDEYIENLENAVRQLKEKNEQYHEILVRIAIRTINEAAEAEDSESKHESGQHK
jgi:pheromone shutdown protein TraB